MFTRVDDDVYNAFFNQVHHIDDAWRLISDLEKRFNIRGSFVAVEDVQDEFNWVWRNEQSDRMMTPDEWDCFKDGWFWRYGYQDVMWEGVRDAIRMDLYDLDLVPDDEKTSRSMA